jgi:membrane peptidoglycan carboxypeptidase
VLLVPDRSRRKHARLDDVGLTTRRAGLLVALCALTGVLVAGVAFPVVAGFGLVAREGAQQFESLPAELVEPPLPQSSRIVASDGSTLAVAYFNENRVVVPFAKIPKVMRDAILAIEDDRFYEHGGVDLKGMVRAAVRNSQAGEVQQGASTITQQYVKNVMIQTISKGSSRQAVAERTAGRKIREARFALELERRYTKDQILEKYLNIAYFGNGVYGVGTAARHYFGVPVERLSLPQAALLGGLVKNPRAYDPVAAPKAAKERRDVVLARMRDLGWITPPAAAAAARTPLRLRVTKQPELEDNPLAHYYLDYVRSTVLDDPDGTMAPIFGDTPQARAQKLFQGGLTIRTSLDARLQRVALEAMRSTLGDPDDPASAAVVVEPGTGLVKVMAGLNHEARSRKVNLPLGGPYGFQAGSTFKMFVLAAAIEQGIPMSTTIDAPQTLVSKTYSNVVDGRTEPYTIRNAGDSEAGRFDIPSATWESVNTAYIQIQEKTGIAHPARLARAMGVRRFPLREVPSFVLGANEVSPLDMASAYATLAARGMHCKPIAITEVLSATGEVLGRVAPSCERVMSEQTADTVTSVLRGVLTKGTGKGARIGRPAAGKTGTTNGPTAAWFDGFTPDRAGVVWVGYPTDPAKRPLRNVHGSRVVYGGGFPATIWRLIMTAAHEGLPVRDFALPEMQATRPVAPVVTPPLVTVPLPPGVTFDGDLNGGRECRGRKCKR